MQQPARYRLFLRSGWRGMQNNSLNKVVAMCYHIEKIPNHEIRNIITTHILTLFEDEMQKDGVLLNHLCRALSDGNAKEVARLFTDYMKKTISVRDTFVRKNIKENFYHGILLGILGFKGGWTVKSNKEAGDGFSDIMIRIDDSDVGIILEVKYAEEGQMERECQKALNQIKEKNYAENMRLDGVHTILKYGITCNKKKCCVPFEKD